jgi:CMP-N,N'-diacetyllegionaminic acid synthase
MISSKKVLAVIPARAGSKGLKNKNIRLLGNKPLIIHSIEAAKNSRYIDRIVVSTDGEKIAKIAKKAGVEIPFLRPKEISRDNTPDAPVFEHCLGWLREKEGYTPEIIVHLRPTGPLRTWREIDEAIELLEKHPKADSVRSVEEPSKPPYKMWKPAGDYMKQFARVRGIKDAHTAPRQSLPKVYQTTADIGVFRLRTLLTKNSIIGSKVLPYVLKRPTIDIDTMFDLKIAELMIKTNEKIHN